MQETTDRLARRLRRQAAWCSELESPLYASLLESAADDLESGGPTAEVLEGFADEPGTARLVPLTPARIGEILLGVKSR